MRNNIDEFGGYCKKWSGKTKIHEEVKEVEEFHQLDTREEDNLCKLVGIDIDQKIKELVAQIAPPSSAAP